jgi:hypothetical protein
MLEKSGVINVSDEDEWMLLHFVVSSSKEAMIQLPQPQYTVYNINYRWATHGIKKSCCKGVDGRFSNFGLLIARLYIQCH